MTPKAQGRHMNDDAALGTAAIIALAVGGLVVVSGVGLYLADFGIEATIVSKSCPEVTAETHLFGIEVTRQVNGIQCTLVQTGDLVEYHIRSGDLTYVPQGGR